MLKAIRHASPRPSGPSLTDLPAPRGGDVQSDDHFRPTNDVLLLDRQEAVDREPGKHLIREVICEHERLGAAIRAAGQEPERS
jgi:hypothetical protein